MTIKVENKIDINKRVDKREKIGDVLRAFDMNHSTVSISIKDGSRIMGHVKILAPMQSVIITNEKK